MTLLRAGLLSGRTVALAGGVGADVRSALAALGASLTALPSGGLDDDQAQGWVRSVAPVHALVAATAGVDTGAGDRLESALDRTWTAVHAVAAEALIAQPQAGKIVLIAPPPEAGEHAPALRAAIENLARTLSVEWARFAVTVTALMPGTSTSEDQIAAVVAFLLSPAGDYFSGCRLELGVVRD
jgi:NAD(P)-dependent dehydrogenase (short-subunit alcohol dehydrogenase family)